MVLQMQTNSVYNGHESLMMEEIGDSSDAVVSTMSAPLQSGSYIPVAIFSKLDRKTILSDYIHRSLPTSIIIQRTHHS